MLREKQYITVLFLLVFYSFANLVSALQHAATLKSFDELRIECSKYLPPVGASYNIEDCSDRCLGLVGRFWNDSTSITTHSVSRFYQPDACDQDYIERTKQCLCETVRSLPRNASCQRASCSIQCYQDQFGELKQRMPQFVPVSKLQSSQIIGECAQILQISDKTLKQILADGYGNFAEGRCLTRCFLVRAGLYSDCRGPNIDRFSIQCEGYGAKYEQIVVKCYAELKAQGLDSCTLATRFYDECIQSNEYSNSNMDIPQAIGDSVYGLVLTLVGGAGYLAAAILNGLSDAGIP
ncbi:general odorant-binding protein 45 [Aedes albopictus]|uniref:Uncharacterized protein n=1 Tax=Aedes albopictus TaxID=7160 RepID=A0ABM1XQP5_AEDAL|nr:general odorant-binding protein 45-like [Aedes albopictus]